MKVRCMNKDTISQPDDSSEWITYGQEEGEITIGESYEVISIENGSYRIIDDSGEDYVYPSNMFEFVEEEFIESKIKVVNV